MSSLIEENFSPKEIEWILTKMACAKQLGNGFMETSFKMEDGKFVRADVKIPEDPKAIKKIYAGVPNPH